MAEKKEKSFIEKYWFFGLVLIVIILINVGMWVNSYNDALSISGLSAEERLQLEQHEQDKINARAAQAAADSAAANEANELVYKGYVEEYGYYNYGLYAVLIGLFVGATIVFSIKDMLPGRIF